MSEGADTHDAVTEAMPVKSKIECGRADNEFRAGFRPRL